MPAMDLRAVISAAMELLLPPLAVFAYAASVILTAEYQHRAAIVLSGVNTRGNGSCPVDVIL